MTTNQERLICEAYRLSEMRLQHEFTASQAADQRAMAFGGIMVAAAAILAGMSGSASATGGLLVSALLLLVSALLAGISARPVYLYAPGAHFRNFLKDIERDLDFSRSVGEMGAFNDLNSAENTRRMKNNATLMEISFGFAVLGAAIAIAVPWLGN